MSFNLVPKISKGLKNEISIRTPLAFEKSITKLQVGGLTKKERQALVSNQNMARLQLNRPNLSTRERDQFLIISKMKIPDSTPII